MLFIEELLITEGTILEETTDLFGNFKESKKNKSSPIGKIAFSQSLVIK